MTTYVLLDFLILGLCLGKEVYDKKSVWRKKNICDAWEVWSLPILHILLFLLILH